MWLRTFNLQKRSQSNFEEDSYLGIKGLKLDFSRYFCRILQFRFFIIAFKQNFLHAHSKPIVKEKLCFELWSKMFLTNQTAEFVKV